MNVCKSCGGVEFNFIEKTIADGRMQLEQRCKYCNTFLKWAKQDKNLGKHKNKYINEWLEGQPATDKQIEYLKILGYKGEVKNKLHASELINKYKSK